MINRLRHHLGITVAVLAIAALVTGCARAAEPVPARASMCATPASTSPVTVTDADSGSAVCLAVGTRLDVLLHGSADRRWTAVMPSGTGLRPVASGKGALAIGVTGGFFAADTAGTTLLSADRDGCGTRAGQSSCTVADRFTLTVVVR